MPTPTDFRAHVWDPARVDAAGKYVARQVYWRLYAIENLARVLIHSVLTVQVGADWWQLSVDPGIQKGVTGRQAGYQGKPWHGTPGKHEVYYAHLSELARIMLTNSHLFAPVIPDIDQWILRIEQIRLPRNIAGHMNWLDAIDRKRIDVFHSDFQALLRQLGTTGLQLQIP